MLRTVGTVLNRGNTSGDGGSGSRSSGIGVLTEHLDCLPYNRKGVRKRMDQNAARAFVRNGIVHRRSTTLTVKRDQHVLMTLIKSVAVLIIEDINNVL